MSGSQDVDGDMDWLPPDVEQTSARATKNRPISMQLRIKFFLTGIVFPAICFLGAQWGLSAGDLPWQSGQIKHYVALLIDWPGHAPVLPLIVISAACLGTWVVRPETCRSLLIQMGVFTGAFLSSQFLIYVLLTSHLITLFAGAIVAALLAAVVAAMHWLVTHARRFLIRDLLILMTAIAILISLIQWMGGWQNVLLIIWMPRVLLIIMAAGPTLCVVTYVRASIWMIALAPMRRFRSYAVAWVSWLAAWVVTWKLSVDIMFNEYAKLPTTDPNCYVSTAAAHGHPRLVGVSEKGGLNDQTRHLKFLELALAAALPRCHRAVRRVYDRVGPPLARVCRSNVWIADASFLMLKPLEWSARLLAKVTWFRL